MKFNYIAFNARNKLQRGVIDASSLKEATKLLIDQGWYVKKIKLRGRTKIGFEIGMGGVSLIDKVLFVKHLGTMLKSGINLNEALEVIADQTISKRFKNIVSGILEKIKTGQNLSNALAKYPRVFDLLFINIIRIGEESGTLDENLEHLADELEDRLELRRKIKAAAFYPSIILSATFGLGLILAYFVLPKIKRLFETLSFDLPLATRILLWIARVMDQYGVYIILGIFFGLIFLRFLLTRKFLKPFSHWLLLKLPAIGSPVINYNMTMITRTLGITLKSGLTIDQAIIITSETTKNVIYQRRLKNILPQVQRGKMFSDAMASFKESRKNPLFPLLAIKMIGVGERSGRLDESLTYLSQYFEKEVDSATKNLTTILEPILLIFVGLVVGFIAISIISPIYQVTGRFGR